MRSWSVFQDSSNPCNGNWNSPVASERAGEKRMVRLTLGETTQLANGVPPIVPLPSSGAAGGANQTFVVLQAFGFTAADDPLALHWPLLSRDGCVLPLAASAVVIEDDPIVGFAQPVSPGGIGEKGSVLALSAARVQYRKPGFGGGVEPPGRNAV